MFIRPILLIVPSVQNDPFGHEPLKDDIPPGKRASTESFRTITLHAIAETAIARNSRFVI